MKKQCTAALLSLVVGGVLIATEAQAELNKRVFGNFPREMATDRVPPLSFPEKCKGEVDGAVPLLTFFFAEEEKPGNESDTALSMFPCGTAQDEETGLPGIIIQPKKG